MKVTLIILHVFALFLFMEASGQPVKEHGALHVKTTTLTDQYNKPVVLRGMSFGWHNFWPRFYNAETVSWLYKDWNCSVVRAAMGVEPTGGYLKDPHGSVEKVKAVVDAAISEGIYVIIDWHSHNINLDEAKAFFADMARTYGAYPNIIYEIFNEPDHESWTEVKAYSTKIMDTIRKYDPDNIILIGSPHWNQDLHIVMKDPVTGHENIMYSVHFYAATHKQALRDRCDAALKNGLPLFISESAGMEASGDGPINEEEWMKWIRWAEDNKVSWVTWSVSDKNESCSVLYPTAGSKGKWQTADLKESGIKTRRLIKKYNGR